MQPQHIQIGTQTITFYQSVGQGPAVLFVHGNSLSGLAFQRQLESPLGEAYRLVAIDLPGHGQSPPAADPAATYTLPGYAALVVGVAEQLGLTEAVFAGWSLGGHIVLEASGQLPGAAGFLIWGAPPLGIPPAMGAAFLPNPALGAAFQAELSEAAVEAMAAALSRPAAQIPDQFRADIRRADGLARQVVGGSLGTGNYRDEIEIVARLAAPLAVVHGQEDQIVNGAYLSTLTMPTLWRGAVQTIPDAGHATHWEQPARFNALLEALINQS